MTPCTYCGDRFGEARDHVVPVTTKAAPRGHNRVDETVPCCTECNSLLGSVLITSVGGRAGYLKKKYEVRYKKLLKTPVWASEELEELSESLRESVVAGLRAKLEVQHRIDHCELIALTSPTIAEINGED